MATKDFTKPREEITFTIAPDTFRAYPAIAADVLISYVGKMADYADRSAADQMNVYKDVLKDLLEPDSYARFVARMADRENPIDPGQLDDVTSWLFEQYGMRPTQPSSPSPVGLPSPEPGTGSTANTPVEVSISEPSLPIAS